MTDTVIVILNAKIDVGGDESFQLAIFHRTISVDLDL